MMRTADRIGLLLSLLGVLAAALVSSRVYDSVPHLEDEMAYVWQARVFASGRITLPAVEFDQEFLVPFVVSYQGERFGKYPPGWPLVLAFGVLLGVRGLVNPILAGISIWLIYLLGKRVFIPLVGLLAAGLTLTSPFFLLNSGSLLSHPLGLALAAGFSLAWLDAFGQTEPDHKSWRAIFTAAACLGFLALTRPLSAVGVALPFGLHAAYLLLRGSWRQRKQVLVFGVLAGLFASLILVWQYLLTGDPLINPYTLWWPYDKIGFGPGYGVNPDGHSLLNAIESTRYSLNVGWFDLFGWGGWSWLLLPFGAWIGLSRLRSHPKQTIQAWLIGLIYPALVLVYMAYWVGSWLYGPRYFYEGIAGMAIFSATGASWLAGWLDNQAPIVDSQPKEQKKARFSKLQRFRALAVTALLAGLVGFNLVFYLPLRLSSMTNLFGINQAVLTPFRTPEAQALTPALVLVDSPRWMGYAAFLELQSPDLTSPFIFAWSSGPIINARMAKYFQGQRRVFTYKINQPDSLKELIIP